MVNTKQCPICLSQHFLSYAIHTKTLAKHFYMPTEESYFHTTDESYFEIALLERLLADIIFKHSSFKGYTKAYNFIAAYNLQKRSNLQYQRLVEVFYAFHLTKYYKEFWNNNLISKQ